MASVHAIRSTNAAWAVAKEADVVVKVRTEVIMARKSRGEKGIVSIGTIEVLSSAKSKGTGGTGGLDDASSGLVVVGTVDAGIWGSTVGDAGGGL